MKKQMNKKGSRYRRLMEIRSRNSFRKYGFDPKSVITTYFRTFTYKDWIIIKPGMGLGILPRLEIRS